MTDCCKWCRFWQDEYASTFVRESSDYTQRQCRRHAPSLVVTGASIGAVAHTSAFTGWPKTDAKHWCGDFERISAEEVKS